MQSIRQPLNSLPALCGLWILVAGGSVAHAAGDSATEQEIVAELKSQEDPTILKRRMWLDSEWNAFKDSSDDVELTVGRLWSRPVSARQDWAVRLKVPLKFHLAGDAVDDSDVQGLGDIKLAVGTAVRINDSWRIGGGVEMRFPSATDEVLGGNAWRPQLIGSVAWDVTSRVSISPSVEYNKSIAEEHGSAPQNFMEVYFPVTFILHGNWSLTPRYEVKVDFANGDEVTHYAKLQLAMRQKDRPLGLSLSLEKPLDDDADKRFQVNLVATYYLQ